MLFSRLLIPVDFTINTDIAVTKALELIDTENAVIHLLHINNSLLFQIDLTYRLFGSRKLQTRICENIRHNLEKLKMKIARSLPGVIVQTEIMYCSIEYGISEACKAFKPQLIIMGKHTYRRSVFTFKTVWPERIAKLSDTAVLTVNADSTYKKKRTIVLSINKYISKRKIELLSILSKDTQVEIHLVALSQYSTLNSFDASNALVQTYRMLRSRGLHSKLVYKPIVGAKLENVSFKYAESINADMLLVSPITANTCLAVTDAGEPQNAVTSKIPKKAILNFDWNFTK